MISLQEELEKAKAQLKEVTKHAEKAEKLVDKAKDKCLTEGKMEGYDIGKKEAELATIWDYLASDDFAVKRKQIIYEFIYFEELIEIQTKDL